MQIKSTLFCLALALCFVATTTAQDKDKKAAKGKERAVKTQTTQLMKAFAPAKMTEEQVGKAKELIDKHIGGIMEARKAQDDLLSKEQKAKRKEAIAKLKEEGVKGNQVWDKAMKAVGLTEDEMKAYNAAKKNVGEAQGKLRSAINGLLTDEQKAAMPKKGGKGKKGKKKKKDDADSEGKTQNVSLKLPGMTWGGCARSVRTALTSVDGITEIKTNPGDNTCTFVAPADLDVKATLNKFAEDGNKHIKDWTFNEGE